MSEPSFQDSVSRVATTWAKKASRPILEGVGLRSYRAGLSFMTYKIDASQNNSKFYEGLVGPSGDGTWFYRRRWGALTDNGPDRGRVDGARFDKDGLDEFQARRALAKELTRRLKRGYKDAFKSRPLGQYPVGLTRDVGFGWGTQGVTQCTPALRELGDKIQEALLDVRAGDSAELLSDLEAAQNLLAGLPNSGMATELRKLLRPPHQRILGNPRFILDEARTFKELKTLSTYLKRQLSECGA